MRLCDHRHLAQQWHGHVDEVVVVDDHITGVFSPTPGRALPRHAAVRIRIKGRSRPRTLLQVAKPGTGWGGTDITDPLSIVTGFEPKVARPGERILMVSTTPVRTPRSSCWTRSSRWCRRRCPQQCAAWSSASARTGEPALSTVLFLAGAGGSLRAGVTENPVRLTRSIKDLSGEGHLRRRACLHLARRRHYAQWVDVTRMPANIVWLGTHASHRRPIEFTMRLADFQGMGGHMERVRSMDDVLRNERVRVVGWDGVNPWPLVT